MKKLAMIVTVGAMAMALPAALQAQANASASANVTAVVQAGLTLTKTADLNFGTTVASGASQPVTVDPTTSTNAAAFTATGALNTPVTVTWTAPASLSGPGTAIVVNSINVIGDAGGTQGGAGAITSGGTVTLDATTGSYYFWVGGQITVGANQTAGTYNGTFTLQVAY